MSRPLDAVFRPRSIAVVGASREPKSVGRQVFDNLLAGGFQGPVFPIHPKAEHIGGVRAYRTVLDVPDPVDLAVLVVPASVALQAVDECGRKGVKGLVVITAGFRETGEEGAKREEALRALLEKYSMRAIGPNCMGVINAHPDVRMNATFSPASQKPGRIAFVSQSGALGMAILDQTSDLGLGLSYFVSLGNKVNVSTNDLLVEWADDPDVECILLYLENFGNPRRFVELARAIAPRKPIIAVKSGRTSLGARAARSHTGALAEADAATEALFEQCGVVRAQTIQELFDHARVFSRAQPPAGRRVAIVTNSGGPGIMATDALLARGLQLADLSEATKAALRTKLLPEASVENPVDVIAGGGPESFRVAVEAVLKDPSVDSVLVIYTPPVFMDDEAVVKAILAPDRHGKPLIACVLGKESGGKAFHLLTEANVPTFVFPESAVRSLAAHVAYGERRRRAEGKVPAFPDADREGAGRIVQAALRRGDEWLPAQDAADLLRCYGLPVARSGVAATPQEAQALAAKLGGRVALKAIAPGLVHKSEAGGVMLNVEDAAAAFAEMKRRVPAMTGALVQEMAPKGREVILGMSADPKFGPLLMFGLGGVYVEVLKDVAFRLAPLTDEDARRMVRAIRGWPLLEGVRGEARSDVPAVEDALLRLSALVTDLHEVAEVDVNPLLVGPEGRGAMAADARVRLWPEGAAPRAPGVVPELAQR